MPGVGLSLPEVAQRIRGAAAPPPVAVTRIVHEGDSISSTTPNQTSNQGDFFSYVWAAANPTKTVSINAQASRTVGGAAMNGDGEDTGAPNTALAQRATDIAFAPQLLTVMLGANDLGTFSTATFVQRLIDWAGPIRTAGIKLAWSPPTPYRQTSPQGNYSTYTARRATLLASCRNPAVWGQWADYYIPIGEHPDFLDSANDSALYGDGVHPSAPVATATTGQARLLAVYAAAMNTLIDASRASATTVNNAVWPVSQTNLPTSTAVVTRFIVAGLAHAGSALGIGVSGGAAQVRLNGGAYGTSLGTGSGNGYRIYNGDVIDLKITTSASNSTAVGTDLTIGSETRTLSYTTGAAVTPASYTHGDVIHSVVAGTGATFSSLSFPVTGTAVLAFNGGNAPSAVTVGGVSAVQQRWRYANSNLTVWLVPIAAAGSKNVVVTFSGYTGQTALSYGVAENVDATPTQISPSADGSEAADSQPFLIGPVTRPASGLALFFFAEYGGGTSVTAATANSGTTLIDEGQGSYQGEVVGIAIASRAATGSGSFNFAYGPNPRIGIAFKAAGT